MLRRWAILSFLAMAAALMLVATPAWSTTFTVTSTADTGDLTPDGVCNTCTLREAMQEASANNNAPTVDVINFSISGDGPHNFSPATELPDIDEPLTIDGYTRGDSTPAILTDDARENTLAFGTNAILKIVIRGPSTFTDPNNGFDVEAGPTTIRGLVLNGFKSSTTGSGARPSASSTWKATRITSSRATSSAQTPWVQPSISMVRTTGTV